MLKEHLRMISQVTSTAAKRGEKVKKGKRDKQRGIRTQSPRKEKVPLPKRSPQKEHWERKEKK